MNPVAYNFGWFTVIPIFIVVFWILCFACLIQLLRFLTKGIKALNIYIDKNNENNNELNKQSPKI